MTSINPGIRQALFDLDIGLVQLDLGIELGLIDR